MGALDFLKDLQGKVVDAATYQLLERNFEMQAENNALLREKNELLQDKINTLTIKIDELEERLARSPADHITSEFFELDGVLFKKTEEGFSETPYCPNCRGILSHPGGLIFVCQACKYTKHMRLPLGRCREILKERKPTGAEPSVPPNTHSPSAPGVGGR